MRKSIRKGKRPLDRVVNAVGGQAELARRLKVTRQAVSFWLTSGQAPVHRVLALEALSGVPRHELRPDIYPVPEVEQA